MIRTGALILGSLLCFAKVVLSLELDTIGGEPDELFLLSNLIKDNILEPYANQCIGNVLNGGFLTVNDGEDVLLDNVTVNMPIFLIRCYNGTNDSNATATGAESPILENFMNMLEELRVVDDTGTYLSRDSFERSVLMITFASCAVCIGMWMVYLVIILLPAENHNGRRFSVQFYVLFSAIYETVMLGKSVSKIFRRQYEGNYQDSYAFEILILGSASYRVGEIINTLLVFLNWDAIIFYMFHNYKRLHKNWLPSFFSNRNTLIIYIGVSLTIIDTTLFGVLFWNMWNVPLRICYKVVDYTIYVLFCGLTVYFISHDFWFVLAPKRIQSTEQIGLRSVLMLIWKDYHETIPLLIYNTTLFVLMFFSSIYFTAQGPQGGIWPYRAVKFLRLVITVSLWGLIDVLERRELILSRETVLGRKIHNNDEYFYDPKLPCRVSTSQDDDRSALSRSRSGDSSDFQRDQGRHLRHRPSQKPIVRLPLKVWKSQLNRARNLKKYSRAKHKKLLSALAGNRDSKKDNRGEASKHRVNHISQNDKVVSSNATNYAVFKFNEDAEGDNQDNASAETELARNYIYDYDSSN